MTGLKGNPHTKNIEHRLDGLAETIIDLGLGDESLIAESLITLSHANLALAYEQRTANLIAIVAGPGFLRSRLTDQQLFDLEDEVLTRLGAK